MTRPLSLCWLMLGVLLIALNCPAQTQTPPPIPVPPSPGAPTTNSAQDQQFREKMDAIARKMAQTNEAASNRVNLPARQVPGVQANPAGGTPVPPSPTVRVPAPPAPTVPTPNVPAQLGQPVSRTLSSPAAKGTESDLVNFRFLNMPLEQVLEKYAELVGRTLLRSPQIQASTQITLRTQTGLTKEEAIQALDSMLALNGITMIPTGEKFITVVPAAQAGQSGAQFSDAKSGQLPEASQYITQIIQLTHLKPSEALPAIQPFAANPQGIVAIENSGIIVLRDYAINVKRMLEIIERIDVEIPGSQELELIPIKYALSTDIAAVLSSFTSSGGGVPSSRSGSSTSASRLRGTGTTGATGGIGGVPTPGVTTPGINTPGTTPGAATGTAAGNRNNFQDRLAQIVRSAAGGAAGGSSDDRLLGDAKIIPDERSNGILVFANKQDMAMIKKIVGKLDVVLPQVLIEAIVMEVSIDDTKQLGFSYGQNPTKVGSNKQLFGAMQNVPFSGAITNLASGVSALPSGFSYYALLSNWEVAVNAIATDSTINVLSRPRIQTSHAVEATLFVGDTVPFITGTLTDINGGARSQFQNQQVGITLDVLPLINQEGLVVLDINQKISQLGNPTTIDGNPVPTTVERNATTKVAVKDGDTIILGGFITSTKSKSASGVPVLKDIPLFGALFRNKNDSNKRVELVVLIHPKVLPTPEVASITATQERNKLSGVKLAEEEIRLEEEALAKKNEAARKKMNDPKKGAPASNATTNAPQTNP